MGGFFRLAVTIILASSAALCAADPLDDRIAAAEAVVRELQADAAALYKSRRGGVAACGCTLHSCSNQFRNSLVCTTRMGTSVVCAECGVEGTRLDFLEPTLLTPPGTDPNNLSPNIIESVCTFKPLDASLVKAGEKGNTMWTYIGTTTGTFRCASPTKVAATIAVADGHCDRVPFQPAL
eukprot:evm.model.scf_371.3 EVM.evm.TU.scf_371.3   scf_371:41370-43769(+)